LEKLEGKRPLGRPRRRWISRKWDDLAQDRDRWLVLVNLMINLRVP